MSAMLSVEAGRTSFQARNLSPKEKKLQYRALFESKVLAMEAYASNPETAPRDLPKNRSRLRKWPDGARALRSWSDPKVDDCRGPNGDLTVRFLEAVALLDASSKIAMKRHKQLRSLRDELDGVKRERDALARQNARLLERLLQLGP